jgi:hypothetical protein
VGAAGGVRALVRGGRVGRLQGVMAGPLGAPPTGRGGSGRRDAPMGRPIPAHLSTSPSRGVPGTAGGGEPRGAGSGVAPAVLLDGRDRTADVPAISRSGMVRSIPRSSAVPRPPCVRLPGTT